MSNFEMELRKLKSGTDIRGVAGEQLNENTASRLALGFAKSINAKKISVGHDSRLSGEWLSTAVCNCLIKHGIDVDFCGLCSTPSMFMTTVLHGADGAIMLTASHHPKDKNGLKFFTKNGGVLSKQLDYIIELASKDYEQSLTTAKYVQRDFLEDYCQYMRDIILKKLDGISLEGFKAVVDAGCGSSGFYASRILQPLGIDISGSQFLNPDGNFPAHAPNPENTQAMQSIVEQVKKTKADIGIIFDADGDRVGIVASDGTAINRNSLIALTSAIILNEKGGVVVTDSVTSEGLTDFIKGLGGKHIRYKRGYQNVISYAKELNNLGEYAPIAIETSGHVALMDNYFLDDGAYLATLIIAECAKLKQKGQNLTDLIKDLVNPIEQAEFRLNLLGDDWKNVGEEVIKALEQASINYKKANSYEGIRVYTHQKDFFMARMSVHDPIIAINIESYNQGGVNKIQQLLISILKNIKNLDITPLTNNQ